ncbi:MAG TPA: response regulator transcription factor [Thermoanaerobaculia bacterium]|nr:response regulator transcription factor [Thermoanaerobaculia bacterium]
MNAPIRVLLVEDQTLVREGLRSLLGFAKDLEVVGEAADGEEALEAVERVRPDVVLLDIRLPKKNGLEVLQELARKGTAPPTLILTTFDDDALLLQALKAGARGFLLKDVTFQRLTEAIREVAAGGSLIRPAMTERALRNLGRQPVGFESAEPPEALTVREREVLRLLSAGLSNREIGEALGVVEGTVKNHVHNILQKLGVRDRSRALLKGIEIGYF